MQPRSRHRITVDIPVVVTTVLDSMDGTIVALSEGGAQVAGCGLQVPSQCQIDYEGHVVFGTVQWSEADRKGRRFPCELTDGPRYTRGGLGRAASRTSTPPPPRD